MGSGVGRCEGKIRAGVRRKKHHFCRMMVQLYQSVSTVVCAERSLAVGTRRSIADALNVHSKCTDALVNSLLGEVFIVSFPHSL